MLEIKKGKKWIKLVKLVKESDYETDLLIIAKPRIKAVKAKGKEYNKLMLPEIPVNSVSEHVIVSITTWEEITAIHDKLMALQSKLQNLIAKLEVEFSMRARILAEQIGWQQKLIEKSSSELRELRESVQRDLEFQYSTCKELLDELESMRSLLMN